MIRTSTLLLLVALALGACGQKGALYLPGTPDPAETPTTPAEQGETDEDEREGSTP